MPKQNHKALEVASPPYPKDWDNEDEVAQFMKASAEWRALYNTCATCGSTNTEVRNHDLMWGDGDVYCENDHYVRMWDSG